MSDRGDVVVEEARAGREGGPGEGGPAEGGPAEGGPEEVLRHLLGVVTTLQAHLSAVATELGLSPSQVDALKYLDAPCSQRELAQCLHFDASNITDIVDRLEARGLVRRTVDPDDRRIRRLVLTEAGVALRRELFERAVADAPVHTLSASEQSELCALLAKIADPVDLPI